LDIGIDNVCFYYFIPIRFKLMKRYVPFLKLIFSFFPFLKLFSMNNSITPRRWAMAALTFACLLIGHFSYAQCTISSGPTPVQVQGFLDPINGDFEVTAGLLFPAYLQTNCSNPTDAQVRFYADAGKTTFLQTAPYLLDCNDDSAPVLLYVAVWDGVNPISESPAVAVQITVYDNTPPDLEAPADVTLSTDPGDCTALGGVAAEMLYFPRSGLAPTFAPSPGEYTDNCGADLIYEVLFPDGSDDSGTGDASGVSFPIGTSTITYTVFDINTGVAVSESFTITVEDTEPPSVTCPADITVNNDPGVCTAEVSFSTIAPTGDNCPGGSIDWYVFTAGYTEPGSSGTYTFDYGTTAVDFEYIDDAGNFDNCTFDVTVLDNEGPTLICPADVTVEADPSSSPVPCEYVVNGTEFDIAPGDYYDNCSGVLDPLDNSYNSPNSSLAGEILPVGIYTIEWYGGDADGNPATCSFTITVEDTTEPTVSLTFNPFYNASVTPGDCSAAVTVTQPNNVPANYTATDCSGIVDFYRGDAIVNGVEDPVLLNAIPAFDPNDALNRIFVLQFPVGLTLIPYYWEDAEGNVATEYIEVFVQEDILPTAKCKNATIALGNDGTVTLQPATVDNGSFDNCGDWTLEVYEVDSTNATFTCHDLGANTVRLFIIDAAGNIDSKTCTVTVIDDQTVTMLCPLGIVQDVNLTGCKANITSPNALPTMNLVTDINDLSAGEFYDNSADCGIGQYNITYKVNSGSFQPFANIGTQMYNLGTNAVTIRIVGPSGIPSSCTFNVDVEDNSAPTLTCPTVAPVNVPIGGCTRVVTWATPTPTDPFGCPGGLTLSSTFASGTPFPAGNTIVTYTATDNAGNAQTCSFSVLVRDTQVPVAKCKPFVAKLTNLVNGTVQVQASDIDNGSTDNCGYDVVSVTRPTNQPAIFTCADVNQTIPVTLTITDNGPNLAGQPNVSSCVAQVTVKDSIAPVANCSALPDTIKIGANGTFVLDANAYGNLYNVGTDNCSVLDYKVTVLPNIGGVPFTPSNASLFTFNCSMLGSGRVLIFSMSDANPNTVTCFKTITVKDAVKPTITAPADITIACDVFAQFGIANLPVSITGTPTGVSDNCTSSPTVAHNNGIQTVAPVAFCPNQTWVRTWSATDASGNTATATQRIRVEDVKKPKFNLPALVTVNTDANQCFATYTAKLTAAEVVDTCTAFAQMSFDYRITYPAGSAPTWNDVTVFTFAPSAQVPFTTFPIGNTVVTWRAVDACGNTQTQSITIEVKDSNAPVFAGYNDPSGASRCGKTYTLPNTPGSCTQLYAWNRPVAANITDCKAITVTETVSDTTIRDYLALVNPFTWPTTTNVSTSAQFSVGSTIVSYTAIDQAGNTTVCSFTVKINDTQKPSVTCPPTQTLAATCPDAQLPDYRNLVMVTDNCPLGISIAQTPSIAASLGSLGVINSPTLHQPPQAGDTVQVTMTVNDANPANTKTCSFFVKLADGDAPIPDVAVLKDTVSYCGVLVIPAPTAKDLCNPGAPNATIYGTPSAPVGTLLSGQPPRYELIIPVGLFVQNYVITWLYDDGFGNVTSQLQNITIYRDTFAPDAICKAPFNLDLSNAGAASVTVADINNGSKDPDGCGPITLQLAPNVQFKNFTCANVGANTVTLIVTDANGNTASCNTVVTVKDVTAPVLSVIPADITVEACDTIPAAAAVTAIDACTSNVPVVLTTVSTQDLTGGPNKFNYSITRTWVATDGAGNSSTGTQTITVEDTEAPVFSPNTPDTIIVFSDGISTLCGDTVKVNITPFVTDCATGADLAIINDVDPLQLGDFSFVYGLGFHTVNFLAEDISGNTASYPVVFDVRDGTPPTAVCINGVSAALQPSGSVLVNTAQFNNFSSDNCPGMLDFKIQRLDVTPLQTPSNTLLYTCADANLVQHPVKLYVKDVAGNVSTCQTYIIIQDNVAPTITSCPADKTVSCTANLTPVLDDLGATDNCPNLVIKSVTDVYSSGSGANCQVLTRTWKASDPVGNMATCTQVINIQDTEVPTLVGVPADEVISCNSNAVNPPVVTATDNCSTGLTPVLTVDTIGIASGACGAFSYTIRRTWTVTDDCGNTATKTQLVKVEDDDAPEFVGMPDTLTFFSVNFATNPFCEVPVSYNVGQHLLDCTADADVAGANDAPFGDGFLDISGSYPVGEYEIIFLAQDVCGNVGVDTMLLRVIDNTTPTMVCNDMIVISLGSNGEATIQTSDIDLGSTDNCGIANLSLSQSLFDCSDLGLNSISMTATDVNGNTNLCNITVNVTLGAIPGFTLATSGTPETYFGADNGAAKTQVTGGVGPFTYLWSNNATTTQIDNLPAGTYTVTVIDQGNGCIQVDTAIVEAGKKITLNFGSSTGCQGQTISVPVTVDNFVNVNGFQFGLQLATPALGSITGVSNVNSNLTGFSSFPGSPFTVFWPSPTPVTLPSGTLLFNVNIQLSAAAIGTSSTFSVPAIPAIVFSQDSSGIPVQTSSVLVNAGTLEINCAVADKKIEGDIRTWKSPTVAVPGVNVALTGTVIDNMVTPASGIYGFALPSGANTTVTPSKSVTSAFSQGINVGDLLLIQTHATPVLNQPITNPYALYAGDINGDKNVNLIDYLLVQQLILGTVQHYSNGAPDWKFVPTSYVFPSPNPLNPTPPSSISHTNVTVDFLDDDFTAVRMGDVTGNAPVNNIAGGNGTENLTSDVFKFRVANASFEAGETVTIPFRAADFVNRNAYQMTLAFDPAVMELSDISMGALPGLTNSNFGLAHLVDGYLTTLWVNNKAITLTDNTVLFTLTFKALAPANALSDILHVGSEITSAEALSEDGETMNIDLEFTASSVSTGNVVTTDFALYQNQPNPFSEQTSIGFRLPEASRATLRILSADGRIVRTIIGNYEQGNNVVTLNKSDLGAAGVYYYELDTPKFSARKKMVLIH
jgi:hypothetical protein